MVDASIWKKIGVKLPWMSGKSLLPSKSDVIAIKNKAGQVGGYYDVTKGQSVIGKPPAGSKVVGTITVQTSQSKAVKNKTPVVVTKTVKHVHLSRHRYTPEEAKNVSVVLKAQGFKVTQKTVKPASSSKSVPAIHVGKIYSVPLNPAEKVARKMDKFLGSTPGAGPASKVVRIAEYAVHNAEESAKNVEQTAITVGIPTLAGALVGGPAGAAVGASAGLGAIGGAATFKAISQEQGYVEGSPTIAGSELIGGFLGSAAGGEAAVKALEKVPVSVRYVEKGAYNPKTRTYSGVRVGGYQHPLANKGKPSIFVESTVVQPRTSVDIVYPIPKTKPPSEMAVRIEEGTMWSSSKGFSDYGSRATIFRNKEFATGTAHTIAAPDSTDITTSFFAKNRGDITSIASVGSGKSGGFRINISGISDVVSAPKAASGKGTGGGISIGTGGGYSKGSSLLKEVAPTIVKTAPQDIASAATKEIAKTVSELKTMVPISGFGEIFSARSSKSAGNKGRGRSRGIAKGKAASAQMVELAIPAPSTEDVVSMPSVISAGKVGPEVAPIPSLSVLPSLSIPVARVRSRAITKAKTKTRQKQQSLEKLEEAVALKTKTVEKAKTETIPKVSELESTLELVAPIQIQAEPVPSRPSPSPPSGPIPPPPVPPIGGGIGLPFPHMGGSSHRNRGKPMKGKYTPSAAAVMLNITATKKPKLVTGVGIRPLIVKPMEKKSSNKKRKNKKKKKKQSFFL